MNVHIVKDATHAAFAVVDEIAKVVDKPHAVLGLPTGSTQLPVYAELRRQVQGGRISLKGVVTFNLDEYYGTTLYAQEMEAHLAGTDISLERVHVLNGMTEDPTSECRGYEQAILDAGGIDFLFGGIGPNGHMGFDEPGAPGDSRTRVVTLAHETRQANARFFGDNIMNVPTHALTMGIGTILEARRVILVVTGHHKTKILHKVLAAARPNLAIPATWLITHPNAVIIADRDAMDIHRQVGRDREL